MRLRNVLWMFAIAQCEWALIHKLQSKSTLDVIDHTQGAKPNAKATFPIDSMARQAIANIYVFRGKNLAPAFAFDDSVQTFKEISS